MQNQISEEDLTKLMAMLICNPIFYEVANEGELTPNTVSEVLKPTSTKLSALKNIIEKNPEQFLEALKKMKEGYPERYSFYNDLRVVDEEKGDSQSMGGRQLSLGAMPGGAPISHEKNDGNPFINPQNPNGFSSYIILAGIAFSIQLVITLICIFFY